MRIKVEMNEMLTNKINASELKKFIDSEPKELSSVSDERGSLFQSYVTDLKAELAKSQSDKSKNSKTLRINYYLGELYAKCPNTYALSKKLTTPEKHIIRMQIAMVYYVNALTLVEKEDPIIPQLILSLTYLCNQSIPASQFLSTMDLSIRERLKKRLEMFVEICQTSPEIVELLQKSELVQIFDVAGVNIDTFRKKPTGIKYAEDIGIELIRQTRHSTVGTKEYQNLVTSAAETLQLEYIEEESQRTALHWAVINENETAVACLIKFGARFNIEDKDGKTAICYAAELKNEMIKKHLCHAALTKINLEWPFPSNQYQMLQPEKIIEAHRYLKINSNRSSSMDLQNVSPEFEEVNKITRTLKLLMTFAIHVPEGPEKISYEEAKAISKCGRFANNLIDLNIAKQVRITNPSYFSSLFYFKEMHKIHQLLIHKPILDGRIPLVSFIEDNASDSFDSYYLFLNPGIEAVSKEKEYKHYVSMFNNKLGYAYIPIKGKEVESLVQYEYFSNNQDFLKILMVTHPKLVQFISILKNLTRQEALTTDRYTGAFVNYLKEYARKCHQSNPGFLNNLITLDPTIFNSITFLLEELYSPITDDKADPLSSLNTKSRSIKSDGIKPDIHEMKKILDPITIEKILKKTNSKSLGQSLRRVAAHLSKAKVITDLPNFDAESDQYISVVKNKAATDPESTIGQLHLLIEGGANLNEPDENELCQKTALHRSIEKNDEAAVAYLVLVRNADYSIQDAQGRSALVYPGNDKIKKILFYKLATDLIVKIKSLKHQERVKISQETHMVNMEINFVAVAIFDLIVYRTELYKRIDTEEREKYKTKWRSYFKFLSIIDILNGLRGSNLQGSCLDFIAVIFKECNEIRKSQISLSIFINLNAESMNSSPFFLIQPYPSLELGVLEKSTILITENLQLLMGKAVSKYINQYPKNIIENNVHINEMPNFEQFPDCKKIFQGVLLNSAKAVRREIQTASYKNYFMKSMYKSAYEALSILKDPKFCFDWVRWVNICWHAMPKKYSTIVKKIQRILLSKKFDPSLLDDDASISKSSSQTIFHQTKSQADKSGTKVSVDKHDEEENDDENDNSP